MIPASSTVQSLVNSACRAGEASKILAHQNPPKAEAATTKPLNEDESTVELKRELISIKMPRITDIATSLTLPHRDGLFTNKIQAAKVRAQSKPVKSLALSPGINVTLG
jgi:hypothetical protein